MNQGIPIYEKTDARTFAVHLSIQPAAGTTYRRNICLTIVTTRLERAVEIALQQYPDAEIWNVSHRGGVNTNPVFVDSVITLSQPQT